MHSAPAQVIEIHANGSLDLHTPPGLVPAAGQYCLAEDPADPNQPLGVPLFLAGASQPDETGAVRWQALPAQAGFAPALGAQLWLRGPLGHGFQLPLDARRVALASTAPAPLTLLPLLHLALAQDAAVALFLTASGLAALQPLPLAVESYPLAALADNLDWADLLLGEFNAADLPRLRTLLRLRAESFLPFPAQVLIHTPLPCGGLADCGVCAVPARRGVKLACSAGPVFDLRSLDW